jgi:hypothetical protein
MKGSMNLLHQSICDTASHLLHPLSWWGSSLSHFGLWEVEIFPWRLDPPRQPDPEYHQRLPWVLVVLSQGFCLYGRSKLLGGATWGGWS